MTPAPHTMENARHRHRHRRRDTAAREERPEHERAEASRRARELVETHPDTRDAVRESGKVELIYDTEVYWTRKLVSPCSR